MGSGAGRGMICGAESGKRPGRGSEVDCCNGCTLLNRYPKVDHVGLRR